MDTTTGAMAFVGSFSAKNTPIVDRVRQSIIDLHGTNQESYHEQLITLGAIVMGKRTPSVCKSYPS